MTTDLEHLLRLHIEACRRWRAYVEGGDGADDDARVAWRQAEADLAAALGVEACHQCGMPRENRSAALCGACQEAAADAAAEVQATR